MSTHISVRLSDDLIDFVRARAAALDLPVTGYIRMLIEADMTTNMTEVPKTYDDRWIIILGTYFDITPIAIRALLRRCYTAREFFVSLRSRSRHDADPVVHLEVDNLVVTFDIAGMPVTLSSEKTGKIDAVRDIALKLDKAVSVHSDFTLDLK